MMEANRDPRRKYYATLGIRANFDRFDIASIGGRIGETRH